MPADVMIRGGTVVDGSGGPGLAGRRRGAGRGDRLDRLGIERRCGAGTVELDASGWSWRPGSSTSTPTTTPRCSGTRRCAVVVPRRHDRGRRQLRASRSRRPGPSTTTSSCARSRTSRTWTPATLTAGIAWDFETFPEYLDGSAAGARSLNFTAYVGHTAVRLFVMGDAAYERAATAEEIDRMCQLVREAIDAGAAGFSTTFSYAHRAHGGQAGPEPVRRAGRGRGAVHRRSARREGAWSSPPRASSAPTPTCTTCSPGRAAVHLPAVRHRRSGKHLEAGRDCTRRASLTGRTSGRR